jgi:hypothetical protein
VDTLHQMTQFFCQESVSDADLESLFGDTVRDPVQFEWRLPDVARAWGSCECARDTRQVPSLFLVVEWIESSNTTLRVSHFSSVQSLKNVLIKAFMSDDKLCGWKPPVTRLFISPGSRLYISIFVTHYKSLLPTKASTQKIYEVCAQESRCLPPDTLFECVNTRERVHISLESCTPSCDAWPFPSLNVSTQTPFLHTLQYYSVTIDLFVFNELCDHLRESRRTEGGVQIPTMILLLITHSPITLSNLSSLNLVYIFRCSSPPYNPVYPRRVDLSALAFSLSSHRHVYNTF